ncbi:hypothetical protein C7I85_24975 [Mesorhizobium soli]|uniref:Uncharacterized protein n=1 Tax=Pseudaminobacter soli (ex Li et al. 2025) TaxID=1295366 RepID=A0A2P7S191_9HYPH|nr:hypothetical protein C7I85_24975 [Mesorhizobium soli]
MLDQLTEYAGDGDVGEFYRRLRYQMARHPVPMVLVGAGIAWMMVSGTLGGSRDRGRTWREVPGRRAMAEKAGDAADKIGEAGSAASDVIGRLGELTRESAGSSADAMRQGANRARDSLGAAAGSASDAVVRAADSASDAAGKAAAFASDAAGRVADTAGNAAASAYGTIAGTTSRTATAVGESARHISQNAASSAKSFVDFCRSEPLVLGSMGVAIGAALGALMPPTQTEDYLMGEKSDRLKENLAEMTGSTEAPTKSGKLSESRDGKSAPRKKRSHADR